jgi:hypothetical protein
MGWLVPKTYLQWREPRAIRRTREDLAAKTLPPWGRPAIVAVVLGAVLLIWLLARLDPNKHPPGVHVPLSIGLLAGLFFVYLLPWLYRLAPSQILITDAGIRMVIGDGVSVWRYKDIHSCAIVSRDCNGEKMAILALTGPAGENCLLGIAPSIAIEDLKRTLAQQGLQVDCEDVGSEPEAARHLR